MSAKLKIKAAGLVLLGCIALGVSGARNGNATRRSLPVALTVFYPLTEASYTFFTNELYPTYLFVNGYSPSQSKKLAVTLKPYTTHLCPPENVSEDARCANIKLHACASSTASPAILQTDWLRLNFISCSFNPTYLSVSRFQQKEQNEGCVQKTCIDASRLAFCANSADGDALLDANLKDFNKLKVDATDKPVILFDYTGLGAEVKAEEQDKGLDNLMALLCDKFPDFIEGCRNFPRVASKKQFRFTENLAFSMKRRCDYVRYANQVEF